jgi:predicted glutamine amidotransferase
MCRLFFIFDHSLKNSEIKRILHQREEKKSKYCISKKDWGPRLDGMGLAYRFQNKWSVRTCPTDPQICGQILVDIPKHTNSKSSPIIIHLRKRCVLENCVASTAPIGFENTHPFLYDDFIFTHNGELSNFDFERNSEKLLSFIDSSLRKNIIGKTDSEQIFYLLLNIYNKYILEKTETDKKTDKIDYREIHEKVVIPFFEILSKNFPKYLANIIFSTPEFSIITRYIHSSNPLEKPLSLYYSTNNSKNTGIIVSSEPIGPRVKLVPEQTVIYVDHEDSQAFLQSI